MTLEWFSPRVWGWSDAVNLLATNAEVFPTRVGMVRENAALRWQDWVFPTRVGMVRGAMHR